MTDTRTTTADTPVSDTTDTLEAPVARHPRRPRRTTRSRRVLTAVALALVVLVVSAGCSVQDMRAWWDSYGVDSSHMTDEEVKPWADAAAAFWANWMAEQQRLSRFDHVLSDEQLFRLRWCESGDNYAAVSSTGAYRGAYQFSRTTWNGVASQHFPEYVGLDPAAASPRVQDAMARALWSMSGPRPWPVCGYRV